jgi:hypothetical protein
MSIIFLSFIERERERERESEEKVGDSSERHYIGGWVENTVSSV